MTWLASLSLPARVLLGAAVLGVIVAVVVLVAGPRAAVAPLGLVVAGAAAGERRRRAAARSIRVERRAVAARDADDAADAEWRRIEAERRRDEASLATVGDLAERANRR